VLAELDQVVTKDSIPLPAIPLEKLWYNMFGYGIIIS